MAPTEGFVQPRRFAEVWQSDAEWPGTIAQQMIVRDVLTPTYGTNLHKLQKALDRTANQVWLRSYLTVGFLPDDMWPPHMLAVAGVSGINMREGIAPSAIPNLLRHELGHVVDKHLMNAEKRAWFMNEIGADPAQNTWSHNIQETFADAVRDMILGIGWQQLWLILI